jgi:hypothetical protein
MEGHLQHKGIPVDIVCCFHHLQVVLATSFFFFFICSSPYEIGSCIFSFLLVFVQGTIRYTMFMGLKALLLLKDISNTT